MFRSQHAVGSSGYQPGNLAQPGRLTAQLKLQPVVEAEEEREPARFQRAGRTPGMLIQSEIAAHNAASQGNSTPG